MFSNEKISSVSSFAAVAERNVIAAVLLDSEVLAMAREIIKPADFFDALNQAIFAAMCKLEDAGQAINLASLYSDLAANALFNEKGGIRYLSKCMSDLPSAVTIVQNCKLVRSDSLRRKLSSFGDRLRQLCMTPFDDVDAAISQLGDELSGIAEGSAVQPWQDFESALKGAFNDLMSQDDEQRVVTGFADLDAKLTGLKPGSLTIVAARPAMGKTAFGLNVLSHVALKQKIPSAFFSLEMTTSELAYRMLSALSSVNGNAIRMKRMDDAEWNRLLEFARVYSKSEIYIDETPALDIALLRERARRLHRQHKIGLIIIDYLQLMKADTKRAQNREQEVATISRTLKSIAKELHIPVIALAQLNRALDARADKHPILSDLRESGSIEQDSDNILFIHREDYYRKDEQKDNTAEIIIAKQRSGPTGVVKLHWADEFTRFSNLDFSNQKY